MTVRLRAWMVGPKMSPYDCQMVAILDLWIFAKLQEGSEIERKVIKTNKGMLI